MSSFLSVLFLSSLLFILSFTGEHKQLPMEPPKCEVYDVEIELRDNHFLSGKLFETTDSYGRHAPGSLTAEMFMDSPSPYYDTLRVYSSVNHIELKSEWGGGYDFVALPSNFMRKVVKEDIVDLTVEEAYGCRKDSLYIHIYPRSIYHLPSQSIAALEKGQITRLEVPGAEAEFHACFFVTRDEEPDKQWLLEEWEAILQTKSWHRPHARNERFWEEKGYVLLCHQLIW